MDEYIERKALREAFENADADIVEEYGDGYCDWGFGRKNVLEVINSVPSADVAPVRHGRWICIRKGYGEYECSVCHGVDSDCSDYYGTHVVTEQDYCPNCGSRMDGDDDALTVPVRKRTRGYRPSASCGAKMDGDDDG